MNYRERLVESDLQELLGGHRPPDLTLRALQRLKGQAPGQAPAPAPAGRDSRWRWWVRAAAVVIALGLLGWLATRPQPLPAGVNATASARYSLAPNGVQLAQGWLLLTDGAPEVRVGQDRVSGVQGRAVAGVGVPAENELAALATELELSEPETNMISLPNRWLTAGALALCVLSGQAMLNNEVVTAQEAPAPQETPKPEDVQAVCRLLAGATDVRVRARTDRGPSGWLRLRDGVELADFKAVLPGALADRNSDANITGRATPDVDLLLTLPGGGTALLKMDRQTNITIVRVPGWQNTVAFQATPALREAVKPHAEAALLLERYPRQNWQAMREQMELADEVEFRDEFTRGEMHSGTVSSPADIARLAALVWPDDMGGSKTHISEYEPFALCWRMPDGEVFRVGIGNAGKLSQMAGNDSLSGPEVLPASSLPAIHELLKAAPPAPGFGVRRHWYGSDSKVEKPRQQFITDEAEWWQVWVEHKTGARPGDKLPDMDLPAVDFRKHVVLAVFGGKGMNCNGYSPFECLTGSRDNVLRLSRLSFQTMGEGVETWPFGIFVLPRDDRAIRVELNVQGMLNRAPVWKPDFARLAAMGPAAARQDWEPVQQWRGSDSRIETECSYRITDAESWRNLWQRHANTEAPELDFAQVVVVAVFGGKQTRRQLVPQDYRFVESLLGENGPVVRIAGQATNDGQGLTPYGIFVLPAGPGAEGAGVRLEVREHPLPPPNSEVDYSETPRWLAQDWTR